MASVGGQLTLLGAGYSNVTPAEAVRKALALERPQLLAEIQKRAGSRVDADDILQIASAKALERCDQLQNPSRAGAWLGRVTRNVLFDELRKRTPSTLPIEELELAPIEDATIDCWCVVVQTNNLKPEYAEILRRVVLDGIPVTKVAAELGLTPNNAMVRLHRARRALKAQLASHCGTTSARSCADCGCDERGCCPRPTCD